MPMSVQQTTAAGNDYGNPMVGPVNYTATVRVDVSALTTAEVDQYGYLKPGVPFQRNGLRIPAAATPGTGTESVYGVTFEPVKVANGNAAADLAAAADPLVAVATIGQINRAIAEDNLGRAYIADEVRALNARMVLIY